MNVVQGKKVLRQEGLPVLEKYEQVLLDIGCGDGKWAYEWAKDNPEHFVIGVDADASSMEKMSHKASRKESKGGLPNILYVQAAGESLPQQLAGRATQIYINFPWGSLLAGTMTLQSHFLTSISSLASAAGCSLQLTTTYSPKYEPQMIAQLGLPELQPALGSILVAGWQVYGWEASANYWQRVENNNPPEDFPITSWWKQISDKRPRTAWMLKLHLKANI